MVKAGRDFRPGRNARYMLRIVQLGEPWQSQVRAGDGDAVDALARRTVQCAILNASSTIRAYSSVPLRVQDEGGVERSAWRAASRARRDGIPSMAFWLLGTHLLR